MNFLKYPKQKAIIKKPDYHTWVTPRLINDCSIIEIKEERICETVTKNAYGLYKVQFRIPNGISKEVTTANKQALIRLLDKMENSLKVIMIEELNNSLFDNILDYQQIMLKEFEKEQPNEALIDGLNDRIAIMRQLELEKKLVQLVFVEQSSIDLFEAEAQRFLSFQRLVGNELIKMLERLNNGVND